MQHFLLSPAAKTLSLAQVFRLSDIEAEGTFRKVRCPIPMTPRFARTVAASMPTRRGDRRGLMVAAVADAVPEFTWLYFAAAQFPISLLPHVLKVFARRALPAPAHRDRRTANPGSP